MDEAICCLHACKTTVTVPRPHGVSMSPFPFFSLLPSVQRGAARDSGLERLHKTGAIPFPLIPSPIPISMFVHGKCWLASACMRRVSVARELYMQWAERPASGHRIRSMSVSITCIMPACNGAQLQVPCVLGGYESQDGDALQALCRRSCDWPAAGGALPQPPELPRSLSPLPLNKPHFLRTQPTSTDSQPNSTHCPRRSSSTAVQFQDRIGRASAVFRA